MQMDLPALLEKTLSYVKDYPKNYFSEVLFWLPEKIFIFSQEVFLQTRDRYLLITGHLDALANFNIREITKIKQAFLGLLSLFFVMQAMSLALSLSPLIVPMFMPLTKMIVPLLYMSFSVSLVGVASNAIYNLLFQTKYYTCSQPEVLKHQVTKSMCEHNDRSQELYSAIEARLEKLISGEGEVSKSVIIRLVRGLESYQHHLTSTSFLSSIPQKLRGLIHSDLKAYLVTQKTAAHVYSSHCFDRLARVIKSRIERCDLTTNAFLRDCESYNELMEEMIKVGIGGPSDSFIDTHLSSLEFQSHHIPQAESLPDGMLFRGTLVQGSSLTSINQRAKSFVSAEIGASLQLKRRLFHRISTLLITGNDLQEGECIVGDVLDCNFFSRLKEIAGSQIGNVQDTTVFVDPKIAQRRLYPLIYHQHGVNRREDDGRISRKY